MYTTITKAFVILAYAGVTVCLTPGRACPSCEKEREGEKEIVKNEILNVKKEKRWRLIQVQVQKSFFSNEINFDLKLFLDFWQVFSGSNTRFI